MCVLLGCVVTFNDSSSLILLQMRVWCVKGELEQTWLLLNTSIVFMEFFEDYFEIPYPLPKQGLEIIKLLLLNSKFLLPFIEKSLKIDLCCKR